jgi:hypothetical protein
MRLAYISVGLWAILPSAESSPETGQDYSKTSKVRAGGHSTRTMGLRLPGAQCGHWWITTHREGEPMATELLPFGDKVP